MNKIMNAFFVIPVLHEEDNLSTLLTDFQVQKYKNCVCVICVNNPQEWHSDEEHIDDIVDNANSISYLKSIGAKSVKVSYNQGDIEISHDGSEPTFADKEIILIDKSTSGNAFPMKKSGVGWARKVMMDYVAHVASDDDIIISMDADTRFPDTYAMSVCSRFGKYSKATAMSVPYYHTLGENPIHNECVLRYESYMRHYMANMLRIKNMYAFTALGSALAFPVKSYKKVGGITPYRSGEDFYLLQNLRKVGNILLWNDDMVFPSGRLSNRVDFGTGPALRKGLNGDWESYPFYEENYFNDVKVTFDMFPQLYDGDVDTPMTPFLKEILSTDDLWSPLRKNYTTREQFVRACMNRVDALRILQYVKNKHRLNFNSLPLDSRTHYDDDNLSAFYLNYCFNNDGLEELKAVRDFQYAMEEKCRYEHDEEVFS